MEVASSATVLAAIPTLHGMPLFGHLLEGAPAKAWALGTGLLCAWIAIGLYRLDVRAWWAATVLMLVGLAAALLNHLMLDQETMLRAVGMTTEQIAQTAATRPTRTDMIASTIVSFGGFTGLLLYVRRYFMGTSRSPAE